MTTYYIDPDLAVDGDGSAATPFNTYAGHAFTANNSYLQKAGTTFTAPSGTSITLGGDNITLGKYGSGADPVYNQNGEAYAIVVNAGDGCVVEDFTIVSSGTDTACIAVSTAATNATVRRCSVSVGNSIGIYVTGAGVTGVTISDNDITINAGGKVGIHFVTGAGGVVSGNTIRNLAADKTSAFQTGIRLESWTGAIVKENIIGTSSTDSFSMGIRSDGNSNVITENAVTGCYANGIWLVGVTGNIVSGNMIRDVWDGTVYPATSASLGGIYLNKGSANTSNIICRNTVIDCYRGISDLTSAAGGGNKIYGNIIYHALLNGIDCQTGSGTQTLIANNTVVHSPTPAFNAGHGIVQQLGGAATDVRIVNNVVTCDVLASNVQCICVAGTYAAVDIDYNCYYVTNGAHLAKLGTTNYDTWTTWVSALGGDGAVSGAEANGTLADPKLTTEYYLGDSALETAGVWVAGVRLFDDLPQPLHPPVGAKARRDWPGRRFGAGGGTL